MLFRVQIVFSGRNGRLGQLSTSYFSNWISLQLQKLIYRRQTPWLNRESDCTLTESQQIFLSRFQLFCRRGYGSFFYSSQPLHSILFLSFFASVADAQLGLREKKNRRTKILSGQKKHNYEVIVQTARSKRNICNQIYAAPSKQRRLVTPGTPGASKVSFYQNKRALPPVITYIQCSKIDQLLRRSYHSICQNLENDKMSYQSNSLPFKT